MTEETKQNPVSTVQRRQEDPVSTVQRRQENPVSTVLRRQEETPSVLYRGDRRTQPMDLDLYSVQDMLLSDNSPVNEKGVNREKDCEGERGVNREKDCEGERGVIREKDCEGERGVIREQDCEGETGVIREPDCKGETGVTREPGCEGQRRAAGWGGDVVGYSRGHEGTWQLRRVEAQYHNDVREEEFDYIKALLTTLKDGMPLHLSSVMVTPSEYDGEDKSVGRSIMQCCIYFQHLTCPNHPELVKVLFMKTFLWGKALEWAEIIIQHRAQEARTVIGFFRLLTARFAATPLNPPSVATLLSATQPVLASGVEDTAHPVPVPGRRDAARPGLVPVPSARNAT
ncbi:hypothetical protein P4O66_003509 [Electrophorus voltai]|uniref:DUF4939 domain-containing protein n=1 Tax=Electrophorus voltai TaxID=2609070 RepID=A0AAD9DJR9_9TELE|nr:hypothetical protein P4O66_003509 [Electrophorus voltai]